MRPGSRQLFLQDAQGRRVPETTGLQVQSAVAPELLFNAVAQAELQEFRGRTRPRIAAGRPAVPRYLLFALSVGLRALSP